MSGPSLHARAAWHLGAALGIVALTVLNAVLIATDAASLWWVLVQIVLMLVGLVLIVEATTSAR